MLNGLSFNKVFNSQTKGVGAAAGILAISTLISRLLGLIRDRVLAGRFGAGEELDIYFAAFRIPDFVFGILIMAGISAVFLPVFSEHFKKGAEEGWKFASNVLNCFLILLIFICGLLAVFAPLVVKFVAPGFSQEQESLIIPLTRIMLLSPIFFGLSFIFSGVAHYFSRFLLYSIAPILYNISIIFGVLFLVPVFGLHGLAYGAVLGAFLHWLIQIPAAKMAGFRYSPTFNFRHSGMLKVFKLMIPRAIGTAAYQVNLIVITAIASTLAVGSIAIFNFSNNLQFLPIGLIGVSFAVAAFPALSRARVDGIKEKFLEIFYSTFRQILFLIIPCSLLIFILRAQLVRLVLGTGEFGWLETRLTAASLGIFCLAVFASGFFPFLVRVFYSFQDIKTPVVIGLFSMILNIILALSFVSFLQFPNFFQESIIDIFKLQGIKDIRVVGLPLAFAVSQIFQFSLLLIFLKKRILDISFVKIQQSLKKIILASALMSFFAYLTLQVVANFVDMETFLGVFIQMVSAGFVGVFVYVLAAHFLKSPEIKNIKRSIWRIFAIS